MKFPMQPIRIQENGVVKFPMQPIRIQENGVVRFVGNRIVEKLLDCAREGKKYDLNDIEVDAHLGLYTRREQMQFAQLIGYSVSGYGDLGYVTKKSIKKADKIADKLLNERK